MVRALFVYVLLAWAMPVAAFAQPAVVSEADGKAIRAVIEDQLGAFQRDDVAAAFAQASPTIQRRFGTAENFMRMVMTGYQPVYRPRLVEFRDIVLLQGQPTQRVFLIGPDRLPVMALYPMERQPDGAWKINGCYLVRAPDEAV